MYTEAEINEVGIFINSHRGARQSRLKEYYEANKELVDAYFAIIKNKKKSALKQRSKVNRPKLRVYENSRTSALPDSNIRNRLREQGFPKEAITPELIELKRNIIKTTRLCRQLKN